MRDIPLLLAFVIFLPLIFARPHVGVLVWCWTALLVPNAYVFGLASDLRFNLITAIATFLSWLVSKESKHIVGSSTTVLLGCLFVIAILSSISTISYSPGDVWAGCEQFAKTLALAFVIVPLITTRARITALLFAVTLGLGFHGVDEGLKFILSGGGRRIWGPSGSIITDNNQFALAVVMLIPILIYLYKYSRNVFLRLALAGCLVLQVVVVIGTASRGGFIGLVALALWIFATSKRKARFLIVAVPIGLIALYVASDRWYDRMETIQTADEDSSFMSRVVAWKINTLVALDHPFIGGGIRSVATQPVWSQYAQKFYLLDFVPTPLPNPSVARAAHSIYFQVLGDMGFLGLGAFLMLLGTAWRNASVVIRRSREQLKWAWTGDLARTLQYCLVPFIVSGAALNMAYFDLAYVVIALLAVLRSQTEERVAVGLHAADGLAASR